MILPIEKIVGGHLLSNGIDIFAGLQLLILSVVNLVTNEILVLGFSLSLRSEGLSAIWNAPPSDGTAAVFFNRGPNGASDSKAVSHVLIPSASYSIEVTSAFSFVFATL